LSSLCSGKITEVHLLTAGTDKDYKQINDIIKY